MHALAEKPEAVAARSPRTLPGDARREGDVAPPSPAGALGLALRRAPAGAARASSSHGCAHCEDAARAVGERVARSPAGGIGDLAAEGRDAGAGTPVAGMDGDPAALVPDSVREVVRSPGEKLEPATRAYFEMRFGRPLGDVRVHRDARAAESARHSGALAYTAGRHVVFAEGRYAPGTAQGRGLLAHELAHTLQEGGDGIRRAPADDAAEARRFVDGVMWVFSSSGREYRDNDLTRNPKAHPNTLRQDLAVMRRWLLDAEARIDGKLGGDPALKKQLHETYRFYVYTAIPAFERRDKIPSWKLYQDHKDVIHDAAGPPPAAKKEAEAQKPESLVSKIDRTVIPLLREARCRPNVDTQESCGNVLADGDDNLRTTGLATGSLDACAQAIQPNPGERHVAFYHSHPRDPNARFPNPDPNLSFTQFDKDQANSRGIFYYMVNWKNEVLRYTPTREIGLDGRTVTIHTFTDLTCTR